MNVRFGVRTDFPGGLSCPGCCKMQMSFPRQKESAGEGEREGGHPERKKPRKNISTGMGDAYQLAMA